MSHSWKTSIRTRLNTYTTYSISCAAVWGVIVAVGGRRLDQRSWNELRLTCAAWWSGWTSATIARAGYPPPKKLSPGAEKRLGIVSLVLVAVGLISAIRVLVAGRRPETRGTTDTHCREG